MKSNKTIHKNSDCIDRYFDRYDRRSGAYMIDGLRFAGVDAAVNYVRNTWDMTPNEAVSYTSRLRRTAYEAVLAAAGRA